MERLADLVSPFVTSVGWLKYDESEQLNKAKVISKEILRHGPMLALLRDVQQNLAFTKVQVKNMFTVILPRGEHLAGVAGQRRGRLDPHNDQAIEVHVPSDDTERGQKTTP